jgi:hypothetical protein
MAIANILAQHSSLRCRIVLDNWAGLPPCNSLVQLLDLISCNITPALVLALMALHHRNKGPIRGRHNMTDYVLLVSVPAGSPEPHTLIAVLS